jgi:site-specific DNA-methyltransferase (adenine-specific)
MLGENITLRHGDCLELMRDIPAGSVDLVLADLPYGTTRNKWDTPIDLTRFWRNVHRVTKQNAAICLFGQMPFTAKLVMSNLNEFRYEWIWCKPMAGGFLNANRMPMRSHEIISVFYKKLPQYNPQFTEGKPYIKKQTKNRENNNYGKFKGDNETLVNTGKRYPRDVITISNSNKNSKHTTAKPVELLEYFIKTYSNPGDTILDNCMGSGSTGIACVNTGRNFIGIELDEKYFNIAKERIEEAERKARNEN